MTKHSKPAFGAMVCAALLLAACGGAAAPAGSTAPGSAAPAASVAAPASAKPAGSAAAPATAKPAGSAAPASASGAAQAAGGSIKIGLVLPLTGTAAETGKDNLDSFNLYMQSINNTVAGRKIDVLMADDQNQGDVALTKSRELVDNQGAQILAGFINTAACFAVATYVKQVQIPMAITGQCSAQALMIDPKFVSPYLARFTSSSVLTSDPAAEWAYKSGLRKGVLFVADYAGGQELADAFASAFVRRGGSIVQEMYPPLVTNDFGPYLAKLDPDADFILEFLPGAPALRFGQQYADYAAKRKTIIDPYGLLTTNYRTQLGDKGVGIVGVDLHSTAFDSPSNKAFMKAYNDSHPNREFAGGAPQGYAGAQVLEAALKAVNGNVSDKQKFMDALFATNIDTAKGPVKLDKDHDVIENVYVFQTAKDGGAYVQKLLQTFEAVSRTWDRSPEEIAQFPFGQFKNKWVGMTKDKLPTYGK